MDTYEVRPFQSEGVPWEDSLPVPIGATHLFLEVLRLCRPSVMYDAELGSSAVTETVGSVKSKSVIEVQPCQCKGIDNKKGIRVKWYMPAAAQLKHSSVEE